MPRRSRRKRRRKGDLWSAKACLRFSESPIKRQRSKAVLWRPCSLSSDPIQESGGKPPHSKNETLHRRNGLRRTGHGHLPCRDGQRRHLRRLRRREDRRAQPGRGAHLRAGPGRAGRAQRGRRPAALHHRSGRRGRRRPASSSWPWARRRPTTARPICRPCGAVVEQLAPHLAADAIVVSRAPCRWAPTPRSPPGFAS